MNNERHAPSNNHSLKNDSRSYFIHTLYANLRDGCNEDAISLCTIAARFET